MKDQMELLKDLSAANVVYTTALDDLTPVAFLNGDRLRLNLRFDGKKYRESISELLWKIRLISCSVLSK